MVARGQRLKITKFDPTNHISTWHTDSIHSGWMKIGMDILLDPRNKLLRECLIFPKIQDGYGGSKVKN